jgi:hypothetical protein
MAWRFIVQPNNMIARFSEVVDDFTHYDLLPGEAVTVCQIECGMSATESLDKVKRAYLDFDRFEKAIETIRMIHGDDIANEREQQLSATIQTGKEITPAEKTA